MWKDAGLRGARHRGSLGGCRVEPARRGWDLGRLFGHPEALTARRKKLCYRTASVLRLRWTCHEPTMEQRALILC